MGPSLARDRGRLDAWCETVGPVTIHTAAPASAPISDRVAIVTWNTHVGAGDLGKLVRSLRQGVFTDGAGVPQFVLLLQEVYRLGPEVPESIAPGFRLPGRIARSSEARMPVVDVARMLELNAMYVPAMRNGPGQEDRGNAILSTLPFDEPLVVELPFERQRRLAIAARIHGRTTAGSSWHLRVATTHLDTSVALMRGGPAQTRARQARALIQALSGSDDPIVVAGDLNTWWGDDEPAVKALRQAFPDAKPSSNRQTTWSGPIGSGSRVDYIFARLGRGQVEVRRIPDRFGSDHYPLMVIVEIKN